MPDLEILAVALTLREVTTLGETLIEVYADSDTEPVTLSEEVPELLTEEESVDTSE